MLESANIEYIKWDMNRSMTEIQSVLQTPERQMETAHRYMLGLYHVLEILTSRFPYVLFEGCSGGGGRFDGGMLYYSPQIWTSDDTDALERLYIQYGTSIVYPISAIGAHVSAVPNHQTGRILPMKLRGDVAMSGVLGYELDLEKCSLEELSEIRQQIEFYKEIRALVQFGKYYRLLNPFENNYTAWQFVSEDNSETVVFIFKKKGDVSALRKHVKLHGLDPEAIYRDKKTGFAATGTVLMRAGIVVQEEGLDFESFVYFLTTEKGRSKI